MATTSIIPLHAGRDEKIIKALKRIIDYVENPAKTNSGDMVTGYQGNISAAESLIEPTADLILNKQHSTAIQAKQVCLDFLLALLNEIGLYEFVDTSSLPDVYTRLSQEDFPQSLSEQHDLVLNAVAELINAFHASISRQYLPESPKSEDFQRVSGAA